MKDLGVSLDAKPKCERYMDLPPAIIEKEILKGETRWDLLVSGYLTFLMVSEQLNDIEIWHPGTQQGKYFYIENHHPIWMLCIKSY